MIARLILAAALLFIGAVSANAQTIFRDGNPLPATQLNTFEQTLDTAASLSGTAGIPGLQVLVRGLNSIGDGQGGWFYWNSTDTATPDGISVIKVTGIDVGRWDRLTPVLFSSTLAGAVPPSGSDPTKYLQANGTWSSPPGGVASVSNSDGSLTVAPTAGNVVASLNTGHPNPWTAPQTYGVDDLLLRGSSTGTTDLHSDNAGATNYTIHVPAANDTITLNATAQTLTGKSIDGGSNTLTNIALSSLSAESANTLVGNAAGSSASPAAIAIPDCHGASNALIWTADSGPGCNTISASSSLDVTDGTTSITGTTTETFSGAVVSGSTPNATVTVSLANLSDVKNGGSATNGQVVTWNSSDSKYEPTAITTAILAALPTAYFYIGQPSGVLWNPADENTHVALSDGNATATATSGSFAGSVRATASQSSGQFYFELQNVNLQSGGSSDRIGFADGSWPLTSTALGNDTHSVAYLAASSGEIFINSVAVLTGVGAYSKGMTLRVAIDLTGKQLWVAVNGGNWNGNATYSPGGLGGISLSGLSSMTLFPAFNGLLSSGVGDSATLATTAGQMRYSLPTGYSAWSNATATPPGTFPIGGDVSIDSSGNATVSSFNGGTAFGTAAGDNTGTSGATIPLLNGTNTYSGASTLNAAFTLGASGSLKASNLLISPTAPTISSGGCTTPTITTNGASAFSITIGSSCTGVSTVVLTMPTAAHGWACRASDITSNSTNAVDQSATGTTSVTLTSYSRTTGSPVAWNAADVVTGMCLAY